MHLFGLIDFVKPRLFDLEWDVLLLAEFNDWLELWLLGETVIVDECGRYWEAKGLLRI